MVLRAQAGLRERTEPPDARRTSLRCGPAAALVRRGPPTKRRVNPVFFTERLTPGPRSLGDELAKPARGGGFVARVHVSRPKMALRCERTVSGTTARIAAISSFVLPSQMRSSTSHWRGSADCARAADGLRGLVSRICSMRRMAMVRGMAAFTPQCGDQERACERLHMEVLWQAPGRRRRAARAGPALRFARRWRGNLMCGPTTTSTATAAPEQPRSLRNWASLRPTSSPRDQRRRDPLFHEWLGESWAYLSRTPPVCTTELGALARGCTTSSRRATPRSPPSRSIQAESHRTWSADIAKTQGAEVNFPLIALHEVVFGAGPAATVCNCGRRLNSDPPAPGQK